MTIMRANVIRTTAMQSADNVYYLPKKTIHAMAMARIQQQRSYEFLKAGFYVSGGVLIGFALANLPALSGVLLKALDILSPHTI
jgi:hypothetical protein